MTSKVAVVLLNYDGKEILDNCISSLRAQSELPTHVLIVDNGSAYYDESSLRARLGSQYEKIVSTHRIESNCGYVGGMNQGITRLLSSHQIEWIMTLSNDTELDPKFFENLTFHDIPKNTGMLAPKVRAMQPRDRLDGAGICLCLDGMSTARGQRETDYSQYDKDPHILMPNGVAAIYRTKMLHEIGLMDESFWAYCEDTDLGLRGWLAGWDCQFLPKCIVYHVRSATLGEHSLKKLYLIERNHYWVAIKNFPRIFLFLNPLFSLYRYFIQVYAIFTEQGQGNGYGKQYSAFSLGLTTTRGIVAAFFGAPSALQKRVQLRQLRRRSKREIYAQFWRGRLRFTELIFNKKAT